LSVTNCAINAISPKHEFISCMGCSFVQTFCLRAAHSARYASWDILANAKNDSPLSHSTPLGGAQTG